jgi:hypothetical protein
VARTAVDDAVQLVDTLVELVVAHGRHVQAEEVHGIHAGLVTEKG